MTPHEAKFFRKQLRKRGFALTEYLRLVKRGEELNAEVKAMTEAVKLRRLTASEHVRLDELVNEAQRIAAAMERLPGIAKGGAGNGKFEGTDCSSRIETRGGENS